MNRYATLNEEIERYNAMAGVVHTKPPCGCDQQDKEIITSSAVDETVNPDANILDITQSVVSLQKVGKSPEMLAKYIAIELGDSNIYDGILHDLKAGFDVEEVIKTWATRPQ